MIDHRSYAHNLSVVKLKPEKINQSYLYIFLSFSAVKHMKFHIFTWVVQLRREYHELSDGCYAHLVEHCTSIAEVMDSIPIQAWNFFRLYFQNCLSCVPNCDDQSYLHIILRSSNIWNFLSFPSNILCICNLCVIMLLLCKAILKYLLYQLGTGGINN